MKKILLLLSSLFAVSFLTNCDYKTLHDRIFNDEQKCTNCGYEEIVKHTITYSNWPEGIENPNPTSFDAETEVIFDGSKILEKPGFSNVEFFVDSNEVSSTKGIDKDIHVVVSYDKTTTVVEIIPNNGVDEITYVNISYWGILNNLLNEYSREDHLFLGWFDSLGNKFDVSSPWSIAESNFTLTGKWKYTKMQLLVDQLEGFCNEQLDLIANCEPLKDEYRFYLSTIGHQLEAVKSDLLENDYSKDEALVLYETYHKALNETFVKDGRYDLQQALHRALEDYLTKVEGNAMYTPYLEEIFYRVNEQLRDVISLETAIVVYYSGIAEFDKLYQDYVELEQEEE